jgi:hypothetical protein
LWLQQNVIDPGIRIWRRGKLRCSTLRQAVFATFQRIAAGDAFHPQVLTDWMAAISSRMPHGSRGSEAAYIHSSREYSLDTITTKTPHFWLH